MRSGSAGSRQRTAANFRSSLVRAKKTLPVALVQERNHGGAEDNLAVIETRVAEAAKRAAVDDAVRAAVDLSIRYITDRHLPDKAIDLIDEAASKLRIEIDSLPTEIDEVDRRVLQLEIELTSLRKEKDTARVVEELYLSFLSRRPTASETVATSADCRDNRIAATRRASVQRSECSRDYCSARPGMSVGRGSMEGWQEIRPLPATTRATGSRRLRGRGSTGRSRSRRRPRRGRGGRSARARTATSL